MGRRRTEMRKIRDTIRLHFECGQSANKVATSLGVARSVIQECLRRAKALGLTWPLPDDLDDTSLERLLYPGNQAPKEAAEPDWEHIHRELLRPGVTRELLWLEYCERTTLSYSYPQFCRLYRRWARRLNLVMRQEHKAGEKLFRWSNTSNYESGNRRNNSSTAICRRSRSKSLHVRGSVRVTRHR